MSPKATVRRSTGCLAAGLLSAMPLFAQDATGCERMRAPGKPDREIFSCGGALILEREPGTSLRIIRRPGSPIPSKIEVQGGAILIDVQPGSAPTQIRTPHAIATVRGTTYVVDVEAEQTSVFVVEGSVKVEDSASASTALLGPGDGVDVRPGEPLTVQEWGASRIRSLLVRFGR